MTKEDNVTEVLSKDGVNSVDLKTFENKETVTLDEVSEKFNTTSWATRIVYNERFGGVLIKQNPGEGNRLHYHPDADECWVILEGEWEWYIDGIGKRIVKKNDIVTVKKNVNHKITCIGDKPGIRFAITKPDVEHIYED
tara:strand:- start:773 stop:1189 length:417 start_codon:yes stop_codon:yes gene_type:complete